MITEVRSISSTSSVALTATETTAHAVAPSAPQHPVLVVRGSERDVAIPPYSSCWITTYPDGMSESTCEEGPWPDPLPSVGPVDDSIVFEFPPTEWHFDAVMGPHDGRSGGPTHVQPAEPGVWEIQLAGRAGLSIVQLGGSGPDGDYEFVFEAELLVDGVEPPPSVHFGGPYGDQHPNNSLARLTLSISQLADDRDPSAKVTIADSTGNRIDVVLGDHQDGPDPEGNGAIVLQSPEPDPQVFLGFGPPPYVYDIELTIGPTTHHAQATYTVGLNGETTWSQPIFDPPLPAR